MESDEATGTSLLHFLDVYVHSDSEDSQSDSGNSQSDDDVSLVDGENDGYMNYACQHFGYDEADLDDLFSRSDLDDLFSRSDNLTQEYDVDGLVRRSENYYHNTLLSQNMDIDLTNDSTSQLVNYQRKLRKL
jgi:hypothetical protein